MVLKLRLARPATPGGSKRHLPRYNIVLAHARTARDSKPLEVLGTYDPIPTLPPDAPSTARKQKDIKLDVSRAQYWLGVGAQPSDTVWRLLSMIGLLEPKYLPTGPQTTAALKSVRFPTHQSTRRKEGEQGGDTGREVRGTAREVPFPARGTEVESKIGAEAEDAFEGLRPRVGATTPAGSVDRGGSAGKEGLANVKGQEREEGLDGESMLSR
ncbi:hypothetical protein MBLNU230_g6802t1 [Neophaeotheca triangularis]